MAQFVPRPDPVTATDVVENLGASMAARYAEAEERMIERVARLAAAGIDADEFPDVTDRLRILRELRAEGARIAEQLADPDEVRRIMAIAEAEGRQAALEQLAIGRQRPNLSGITGTSDRAVGALTLDLASGLDNMSARITRWMPDAYQQVVSLVAPQVLAGVVTITQAQRQAAQRFLARGVTGFTDRAGRNWRIGTYAEMATRTAVHRAWTDANVGAMRDQAGIALVQIVIGLDACSVCAAHAGRVWSTDGTPAGTYTRPHAATGEPVTVTVAGTLEQARASGWDHPNCRCTVVGYFPGLTVPSASTHDPQAEADRDRLRELERRVRDLKRREAAAFDDITRQQLRRRIRGAQANIREHVATTGQVRKPYREQLGFSDGTSGTPRTPSGTRPPAPAPSAPPTAEYSPEPLELPAPVVDEPPAWIRPPQPPPLSPEPPASIPSNSSIGDIVRARQERRAWLEEKFRHDVATLQANAPAPRALPQVLADVRAARTAPEVAQVLGDQLAHRGIRVQGITRASSVDTAREFAETVLDLIDRFPETRLHVVGYAPKGAGTYAFASFSPTTTETGLFLNTRVATTARRDELLANLANDVAKRFHPPGTDNVRGIVAHEFGHVLDYGLDEVPRRGVRGVLERYITDVLGLPRFSAEAGQWRTENLPGYSFDRKGGLSQAEALAEAFSDVYSNGPDALEVHRIIVAELLGVRA